MVWGCKRKHCISHPNSLEHNSRDPRPMMSQHLRPGQVSALDILSLSKPAHKFATMATIIQVECMSTFDEQDRYHSFQDEIQILQLLHTDKLVIFPLVITPLSIPLCATMSLRIAMRSTTGFTTFAFLTEL